MAASAGWIGFGQQSNTATWIDSNQSYFRQQMYANFAVTRPTSFVTITDLSSGFTPRSKPRKRSPSLDLDEVRAR